MKWNRGLLLAGLLALMVLPVGAQQFQPPKQPDLVPNQFIPGSVTLMPGNPSGLGNIATEIAKDTGLPEDAVKKVRGPWGRRSPSGCPRARASRSRASAVFG